MARIKKWVNVRPDAIKNFLNNNDIDESTLSGGLYLDKKRLKYILRTKKADLIDAKMLTRFCKMRNIDEILEFTDNFQRWQVFMEARAW